jgi:hypothetical protein
VTTLALHRVTTVQVTLMLADLRRRRASTVRRVRVAKTTSYTRLWMH